MTRALNCLKAIGWIIAEEPGALLQNAILRPNRPFPAGTRKLNTHRVQRRSATPATPRIEGAADRLAQHQPLGVMMISTRRLAARPAAVSFDAIGS